MNNDKKVEERILSAKEDYNKIPVPEEMKQRLEGRKQGLESRKRRLKRRKRKSGRIRRGWE